MAMCQPRATLPMRRSSRHPTCACEGLLSVDACELNGSYGNSVRVRADQLYRPQHVVSVKGRLCAAELTAALCGRVERLDP